ncbi:MAG: IS21-like element helper ATPase IstB [Candidatus Thorarchaeota archaeon]|jgi:DNA replication protein DnaC
MNELKHLLKKLRLSGILITLQDRIAYAKRTKLSYMEFLELVLQDELARRRHNGLSRRMKVASLNPDQNMERFDWDSGIEVDRDVLKELLSLEFIDRHENVIFCGPVGVGKTFLANALAHSACRRGKKVLMERAKKIFKSLRQSRADNSFEKELVRFIGPDLLVIDDLGLQKLTTQEAGDFYEIVVERHGRASTIITSNRHVDEWEALFDDPIMANSALDRIAHNAYQLIMEGESYRNRFHRPNRGGHSEEKNS